MLENPGTKLEFPGNPVFTILAKKTSAFRASYSPDLGWVRCFIRTFFYFHSWYGKKSLIRGLDKVVRKLYIIFRGKKDDKKEGKGF
jgi:hypothetical protein